MHFCVLPLPKLSSALHLKFCETTKSVSKRISKKKKLLSSWSGQMKPSLCWDPSVSSMPSTNKTYSSFTCKNSVTDWYSFLSLAHLQRPPACTLLQPACDTGWPPHMLVHQPCRTFRSSYSRTLPYWSSCPSCWVGSFSWSQLKVRMTSDIRRDRH